MNLVVCERLVVFLMIRRPPRSTRTDTLFPYTTLFQSHAFPKLGDVATGGIAAADIIDVLLPIWQEIPETARQVRNRICVVLDYSHAKGWRSTEAPSGNSSLKAGRGLPRQVKSRENRKAMPYSAMPHFIAALHRKPAFGRLALEQIGRAHVCTPVP